MVWSCQNCTGLIFGTTASTKHTKPTIQHADDDLSADEVSIMILVLNNFYNLDLCIIQIEFYFFDLIGRKLWRIFCWTIFLYVVDVVLLVVVVSFVGGGVEKDDPKIQERRSGKLSSGGRSFSNRLFFNDGFSRSLVSESEKGDQ